MSDAPEVLPNVDEQPTQADLDLFKKVLPNLSPLARAVYEGDWTGVKALVRLGARFDEVRRDAYSPLTVAIALRRAEMVEFLLESGADPNVHDGALLGYAASRRQVRVLRALLDHGAKVNALDSGGRTAISRAAELGLREALDLLIERGASRDQQEAGGLTPLMFAAMEGHPEIAARLITAGTDLNVSSEKGSTAISLAAAYGHRVMVRDLLRAGARKEPPPNGWNPVGSAAANGHLEIARDLLDAGADPNAPSEGDWSPLTLATYYGHVLVVRLLLERGADVNGRDAKGRTALMWASWRQFRRCYDILLAAGADAALEAPRGVSPRSAPPVPPMRRSGGIPREGPFVRLLSRAMVWGGEKRVILGIPVTINDIDGQESVAFDVVEKALRLLERHAPSELGRVRRAFVRIIVTEMPHFRAAYADTHRWCLVNWEPKKPALSSSEVAALLAHEATHYRLSRLGFGYRQTERVRVERACSRAALRLSRRLPGREAGVAVSREHLRWIDPDGLSDATHRAAGLTALKKLGIPAWALRLIDWTVRRMQKKRERS